MSNYEIHGGKKLHGTIDTNSSKNAAVAILCATAMIKGKITLVDVPEIEEVKRIMEILNSINIKVEWTDKNQLAVINSEKINLKNIDKKASNITRSSILLIGALATQLKKFSLYKPGGCNLGIRTVQPHIIALEHLGIQVLPNQKVFHINASKRRAEDFVMYEMSDTGTENVIMSACLTPGVSRIKMASSNYMVQDLCYFLNQAGAKIVGIGTPNLTITGVKKLKPVKSYSIMPDPIESMAFISVAITTGSKLVINQCPVDFLGIELEKLRVMGQKITFLKKYKSKNKKFNLADILVKPSKLAALPDKISTQSFPGLNIDNLAFFIPILTQTKGETLVHDWVYENRVIYYTELNKLGADITMHDPHRVTVRGVTKLQAAEIICPPALRPAMNILIAMLAAKGKSTLRNLYSINRGYEDIINRLRSIGADIRRIN